jgi:PAS domain S-box-containing protein
MRRHPTLFQRGLALVALALVLELAFVAVLTSMLSSAQAQVAKDRQLRTVVAHLHKLSRSMEGAATSMVGTFVDKEDEAAAEDFDRHLQLIPQEVAKIKVLLGDFPNEETQGAELESLCQSGVAIIRRLREAFLANDMPGHFALFLQLKQVSQMTTARIDNLLTQFRSRQDRQSAEQARSRENLKFLLLGGLSLQIILAVVLIIAFNRVIVGRLRRVTTNTTRFAAGQPLLPLLPGNDEINQVDKALHAMAQQLSSSISQERAVIEGAQDAIFTLDADGKFTSVNPAASKLWGFSEDELLGRRFTEPVVPELREPTLAVLAMLTGANAPRVFESTIVHKNGQEIDMIVSPHWSPGDRSLFCVAHDITQRKRVDRELKASEERFGIIAENLPVALLSIDSDSNIVSANRAAETIFRNTRNQLQGKRCDALIKNITAADIEKSIEAPLELDARRQDGEPFAIELAADVFQSAGAQYFLLNIQDITKRKETAAMKQEFVTMIKHDLSTPLSSIATTFSDMLDGKRGMLPPKATAKIQDASHSLRYMVTLLDGLLNIERMSTGRLELRLSRVNMASIMQASIEAVRGVAEKRGIEISKRASKVEIIADENSLVQVLVNLLSNALKFSPQGSTVTLGITNQPKHVIVTVADQGRGVPPEQQERIFQRFAQIEASDASQHGGTGLGLAICKAIIEHHNGEIGVNSEPGQGSVFWFKLPKTQPASEALQSS